ncbi:DUF4179 domain-containing protein [Romboutsia weinsteinii]|uniref:DUF4179 domain-containing protein n=1 Tax=Romboutsia weinsteinii TaxID=2020949 RepID=A0A371J4D2_9FIRM|nr:DUF4179 domain-containing protein [Romboutsia weinsteinii]RDY27573.1 DUF4179 domain-containing protein [Romboutsia weinsteinii]
MKKLDNIKIPENFDSAIDLAIDKAIEDKKKNQSHKKKIIAASISGSLIIGAMALSSETTWAYIENLTRHIESYFGRNNNELDKYKSEQYLVSQSKGLKYTIEEIMLDDRQLVLSMTVDYSKYKWGINLEPNDLIPSFPTITIDDLVFSGQGSSCDVERVPGEKKNKMLFRIGLSTIDTDGDGAGDTEYEIIDMIEKDKEYDLNISFDQLNNFDEGDWEFNTKINGTSILEDTKVYKVNKKVAINENEYKGDFEIEEVRVSPLSVKIKYNYDLYDEISVEKRREPRAIALDESGNEMEGGPGEGGRLSKRRWYIVGEYILKGNEKKITIVPRSYVNDKPKIYEDGKVEIELE